ncbi:MAG: hypothetical protein WAM79_21665 [Candidatus Sulfotelmatobacter sp.]
MRRHWEASLGLVALGGFLLAALVSSKMLLGLIGIVSVSCLTAAILVYFYRAWRRVALVPNQREYAVWVGLEILFALGLVSGCVYMVSASLP